MSATKLNTIKQRIKHILDMLQVQGVLNDVQVDDFKKDIFLRDFSRYPVAVLTTPALESTAETNVQNTREYVYDIVVLMNAEEVTDPAEVEDLMETIINKFDNDPTLKGGEVDGAADAGVLPSVSSPGPVLAGSKHCIGFNVTIRARAVRDLTFV